MQAIGYTSSYEFLEKGDFSSSAFFKFLNEFLANSRKLARKQSTFFRKLHQFKWVEWNQRDLVQSILERYQASREQYEKFDSDESERAVRYDKLLKDYHADLKIFSNPVEVEEMLERIRRIPRVEKK